MYALSRDHTLPFPGDYFLTTPCYTEQEGRVAEIVEYSFSTPDLFPLGENHGCLNPLGDILEG